MFTLEFKVSGHFSQKSVIILTNISMPQVIAYIAVQFTDTLYINGIQRLFTRNHFNVQMFTRRTNDNQFFEQFSNIR